MHTQRNAGFTLIEILVVVAIISLLSSIILSVVTIARSKSRDARRIADTSALHKAVVISETYATGTVGGLQNIVYTSLPDTSSTCVSWNLPPLKPGWSYNCVLGTSLANTDGSGWLPVNLKETTGEALLKALPVDPINDATHYYRYVAPQGQVNFAVGAATLEQPIAYNGPAEDAGGITFGPTSALSSSAVAAAGGAYAWNGWRFAGTQPLPPSGGVVGTVTTYSGISDGAGRIAFDGTNMWVTMPGADKVVKVSPAGATTTYQLPAGAVPMGLAFDGTNMWVCDTGGGGVGGVTKISPSGQMTTYSTPGSYPNSIAFDGTNMWVANLMSGDIFKIDAAGVSTLYGFVGSYPNAMAFDGTNMWVINGDSTIAKVAPDGTITPYTLPAPNGSRIAFDGTNMWVTAVSYNGVMKVAPNGTVTEYLSDRFYESIAFDGANMWLEAGWYPDSVRLEPNGTFTAFPSPDTDIAVDVAFDGTSMWYALPVPFVGGLRKVVAR